MAVSHFYYVLYMSCRNDAVAKLTRMQSQECQVLKYKYKSVKKERRAGIPTRLVYRSSNGFETMFFVSMIYGISAVCLARLIAISAIS